MKTSTWLSALLLLCLVSNSQLKKVELYDLVRKMAPDSGLGMVGDWAVGSPAAYPIKWKSDRIEMSDDIKINFFRTGMATIAVKGKILQNTRQQVCRWTLMLRGPRAGFTNYALNSEPIAGWRISTDGVLIDSLLGNKPCTAKLLKACNLNASSGFNYYQLKLPKKDPLWVKLAWIVSNGACSINLDVYDEFSKTNAAVECGK